MERETDIAVAQKLFGSNFIGPEQLNKMADIMGISPIEGYIPKIGFSPDELERLSTDYILIFGNTTMKNGDSLTINAMAEFFGKDPLVSQPCFYNQDWYLNESFASKTRIEKKWYLVKKEINNSTRGKDPNTLITIFNKDQCFPSAILCAYTFFAYYLISGGETLWEIDFIWCSDLDHNGDRIYVGKYRDPKGVNKEGFEVHRHLSLSKYYGSIDIKNP